MIKKVGIIEDFTENALRQEVLNQHFLNRLHRQIRVDGFPAGIGKLVKGLHKCVVGLPFPFNDLQQPGGQFRHFELKFLNGALPFLISGRLVLKEGLEQDARINVQPYTMEQGEEVNYEPDEDLTVFTRIVEWDWDYDRRLWQGNQTFIVDEVGPIEYSLVHNEGGMNYPDIIEVIFRIDPPFDEP